LRADLGEILRLAFARSVERKGLAGESVAPGDLVDMPVGVKAVGDALSMTTMDI
jgi:hypothetical protein